MAKHKDINKTHALLQGKGWHIIQSNNKPTKRRSKRKCAHYIERIKDCRLKIGGCCGAGKCKVYREY